MRTQSKKENNKKKQSQGGRRLKLVQMMLYKLPSSDLLGGI
jgi:hypothetical protein